MRIVSDAVSSSVVAEASPCCPAARFCRLFHTNNASRIKGSDSCPKGDPYAENESIYLHGEHFHSIFIVCEGVIKTETETADGKLQITGFYMAGEMFGLEGVGSSKYPGSAVACIPSRVCRFTYESVLKACVANTEFLEDFLARMGKKVRFDSCQWKLMENEIAYYRVLLFLCDLLRRQQGGRVASSIVDLPMEKRDISNFLGMNPSTLSRELLKLEGAGLIMKVSNEQIHIENAALSIYRSFI